MGGLCAGVCDNSQAQRKSGQGRSRCPQVWLPEVQGHIRRACAAARLAGAASCRDACVDAALEENGAIRPAGEDGALDLGLAELTVCTATSFSGACTKDAQR